MKIHRRKERQLDVVQKLAIAATDCRYAEKKLGNGTLRLIRFGDEVRAKISIYGWEISNDETFATIADANEYFEAMVKKHKMEEKEYVE